MFSIYIELCFVILFFNIIYIWLVLENTFDVLLVTRVCFCVSLVSLVACYNTSISLNFCYVDELSLLLILLTAFLFFECILFLPEKNVHTRSMCLCLSLLYLALLACFYTEDTILFYVFFEAILIPLYLLIGFWGSRERKVRAANMLFFYTIVTSLLLLLGILYVCIKFNTSNFFLLSDLCSCFLSLSEQYTLWLLFFFSFASKIPMFPFHVWLPEAHVEAPTIGSVLLAGILLKIGVYGFIRFNLNMLPFCSEYFSPIIFIFCIIGIIYASLTAIRQTDIKRIIAYSSIAHMNLVVIGLFGFEIIPLQGAIFQSISHGFVSGSLFFLIGFLYSRYHSRLVYYYSGLVQFMPLFCIFFLFFTLSNIAVPGTSSFIGEFLLLLGLFNTNIFFCVLAGTSVILSGAYSLWLYNRIAFGNIKNYFLNKFIDLTFKEFFLLLFSSIFVLIFGIKPNLLLELVSAFI